VGEWEIFPEFEQHVTHSPQQGNGRDWMTGKLEPDDQGGSQTPKEKTTKRVRKRILPEVIGPPRSGGAGRLRDRLDAGRDAFDEDTSGEQKRRRSRHTAVELDHPVLRLRQAQAEVQDSVGEVVGDLLFRFENTPRCEVRKAATAAELGTIFTEEAARGSASEENWIRLPQTSWITKMVEELGPDQRRKLSRASRELQGMSVPEADFMLRWSKATELASLVLTLWFEGKSFEDVLARATERGHLELPSGCVLEGDVASQVLAAADDMSFERLLPMVKRLSGSRVSLYSIPPENCFQQDQEHALPIAQLRPHDGQGSLNTTWFYDEEYDTSGVQLLDEFHSIVHQTLHSCPAVRVNPRMYLIWKFQHYVTSYHQDTHVPPHFTTYNQVSGVSLFHFLPLLIGLYVTYVGRRDPQQLHDILERLDKLGMGSLAPIGPGQVLLIFPFGSHGVWVPSPAHNESLPKFQVSLIRAAELFVTPALESIKTWLHGRRWNKNVEPTAEEVDQLTRFVAAQKSIRNELNLSKRDWAWLVARTWDAMADGGFNEEADDESEVGDHV